MTLTCVCYFTETSNLDFTLLSFLILSICYSSIIFFSFVKLRYDLGKGVGEAVSNVTVSLNTWYTVKAIRNAKNGSLAINDGNPVYVTSPGSAVALDVRSNFYLGGVRKLSNVNPRAVDNAASFVQDFSGCIDYFEVG